MKLFITNKDDFTKKFDELSLLKNNNYGYYTSNEIHKKAFTELSISIDVQNSIPLVLTPPYSEFGDGIVLLDFQTKKGDIYYYEFSSTAS